MIRRTKTVKPKHSAEHVTNREPLVREAPADHPVFAAALRAGDFEREDLCKGVLKFRNDFSRQVYYLTRLGARMSDVAEFFGVMPATVHAWGESNEDFQRAVREGSTMFGMKVAETLGQRALGYDYTETETAEHMDRNGHIRTLTKVTHKHMPPDVTAIIFYLKNRHRDQWADVNRVEVDTHMTVDVVERMDLTVLTAAEREMVKSIAIKSISAEHGITHE
jgi:hypothetical protein